MNNRLSTLVLAAVVAAGVAFGTAKFTGTTPSSEIKTSNGTLEKVVSSGVIRCGYVPYPPGFIKDPNTGEISGIFPEVLEKAAENLGLKVEWAEEVGWGTMVEGLNAGRYDMIGSPVWPTGPRVRVADFSIPIYYSGVEAYVRADDIRFDSGLEILNDPQFSIATTDGEVTELIAQQDFPQAKRVSLPQLTDLSQLLLTVADGKADITIAEPQAAYQFMQKNPGRIKAAQPGKPLRLSANDMMLQQADEPFRRMIDLAVDDLHNSGIVDKILRKYEPYPNAYYRRSNPVQAATQQ